MGEEEEEMIHLPNQKPPPIPSSSSSSSSSPPDPPKPQLPPFYGFTPPIMYPVFLPPQDAPEQPDHGPGIYALPSSFFPSNTLIPFTYNLPTGPAPSETGTQGEEQGQPPQAGQQRQVVVRRFQIAIHVDLMLLFKLAAVIFLFNQDGSRKRLVLLIFVASLIYLYQTGALAPLIRWLSQGMQRAGAPPQQPRPPAVRADNVPAPAARQENENAPLLGGGENENRVVNEGEANEENANNNRWWAWGIVKEIQLIVFGFITSLLPGFHNID